MSAGFQVTIRKRATARAAGRNCEGDFFSRKKAQKAQEKFWISSSGGIGWICGTWFSTNDLISTLILLSLLLWLVQHCVFGGSGDGYNFTDDLLVDFKLNQSCLKMLSDRCKMGIIEG